MASHNITAQNLIEFVPPLSLTGGPIASCWIVRSGPNMHSGPIIHITYDKSHALQTIRNEIYAKQPRGWDNLEEFLEKGGVQLISAETNRDMGTWWRYMTVHGEERSLWLVLQTWRMEMVVMRTPQGLIGSAQGGPGTQNVLHAPLPTSMTSGTSSAGGLNTQQNNQQSEAVPDSSKKKDENGYASMAEELGNIFGNTAVSKPILCGTKPPQPSANISQDVKPPPYTGFKPSTTTATNNGAPRSTQNFNPPEPFFGQIDLSQPTPSTTSQNPPTVSFTNTQQPVAPAFGNGARSAFNSPKPADPVDSHKPSPGQPASTSLTQPATWSFAPLVPSTSGHSTASPGTTFKVGSPQSGFGTLKQSNTVSSGNTAEPVANPHASVGGSTPFSFRGQSSSGPCPLTAGGRPVKKATGVRKTTGYFS